MKHLMKINEFLELKNDISDFIISDFKESRSRDGKPNYYYCEAFNKKNKDKIEVNFVRYIDKTWQIDFSVNDKYDPSLDNRYNLKEYITLLSLIRFIISNFCERFKPNSLMITGNNDKKYRIYKKMLSNVKNYYISVHPFIKDVLILVKKSLLNKVGHFIKLKTL